MTTTAPQSEENAPTLRAVGHTPVHECASDDEMASISSDDDRPALSPTASNKLRRSFGRVGTRRKSKVRAHESAEGRGWSSVCWHNSLVHIADPQGAGTVHAQ